MDEVSNEDGNQDNLPKDPEPEPEPVVQEGPAQVAVAA